MIIKHNEWSIFFTSIVTTKLQTFSLKHCHICDCFAKLCKLLGVDNVSQITSDLIKSMGVLSNIGATCCSVMSHVP